MNEQMREKKVNDIYKCLDFLGDDSLTFAVLKVENEGQGAYLGVCGGFFNMGLSPPMLFELIKTNVDNVEKETVISLLEIYNRINNGESFEKEIRGVPITKGAKWH